MVTHVQQKNESRLTWLQRANESAPLLLHGID